MNRVRAGLRHHRDRGPARHALFRIEVVGGNVDRFDGFGRRHISGVVGEPDENAQSAVDARGIIVAIDAVDIGAQSASRGGLNRVLVLARRRAGNQVDQALIIAIPRKRKIGDGLRAQVHVKIHLLRLQSQRRGLHRDRVSNLADLQRDVLTPDRVDYQRDVFLSVRSKALSGYCQIVAAGQKIRERIRSCRVRRDAQGLRRAGIHDGYRASRDHCARAVVNHSHERPIEHLRPGRPGSHESHYQRKKQPHANPGACEEGVSHSVTPVFLNQTWNLSYNPRGRPRTCAGGLSLRFTEGFYVKMLVRGVDR